MVGFGGDSGFASETFTSVVEMEERMGRGEVSGGEVEDGEITLGADCTLVPPPTTSVGERAARCWAA